MGGNPFHGTDDFWGRSSCGVCGGYIKPTSLGRQDSWRNEYVLEDGGLAFGIGVKEKWDVIYDLSQVPRNDVG